MFIFYNWRKTPAASNNHPGEIKKRLTESLVYKENIDIKDLNEQKI